MSGTYDVAPRKPAWREPCNGCGICCAATPCNPALDLVRGARHEETCPALEHEGGRAWCGLVRHPELYLTPNPSNPPDAAAYAEVGARMLRMIKGPAYGRGCASGPRDNLGSDPNAGFTLTDFLEAGGTEACIERMRRSDMEEVRVTVGGEGASPILSFLALVEIVTAALA